MWVVIDRSGDDLPEAFGPFRSEEAATKWAYLRMTKDLEGNLPLDEEAEWYVIEMTHPAARAVPA